jgi:nickel-dependent lactate racemase
MAGYDRPTMTNDQVRYSITNLMRLSPIREIAKGKHKIVIIFDDIARVTKFFVVFPFVISTDEF